ncbi:hypothetical protein VUR80DRAFT_3132 [Thermomyces stellatus]
MERPQKRPRLGLAPHDESDDDDELNYEPEEVSQRRDPSARLARSRATAAFGLKSAFESIFEKYERDFEGIADEIDLRTGDIVVDNRHLQEMRNERDMGNVAKESEEGEFPVHDSGAPGGEVGRVGSGNASAGYEDEDRVLQGKSSALVRKAPGAVAPRTSSSLCQRPGISSQLGGPPKLPPLGASPLFFGSWGPPGAVDPAWQAPQLQVPQFKSSFAANLFSGRYQLPAREASKSIWAPGSHSDDEEDIPPQKPRMRLAPPTRRVPARPKPMKLIRAPPANADDSGDEDFILMGVNSSQVPNEEPKPLPDQQHSGMDDEEADLLLDQLETKLEGEDETEYRDRAVSSTSIRPISRAEEAATAANFEQRTDQTRDTPGVNHPSSPKAKKNLPANKRKGGRISRPRKIPALGDKSPGGTVAGLDPPRVPVHRDVQRSATKQQGSVVIELPSTCVLDDGSYLDFSSMVDQPTEEPLSIAMIDDHQSHHPEDQQSGIVGERKDDQIPSLDRTIPDSQDPPISLPNSSASDVPAKQVSEKPPQNRKKEKMSSVYDLSDEEVGFLARPPRKRKRIPDITSPATISEQPPAEPIANPDGKALAGTDRLGSGLQATSKPATARNSSSGLLSPARTRSAEAKANLSSVYSPEAPPSDGVEVSTCRVLRKRRLTPVSLNPADDTEGEAVSAQKRANSSFPVPLVSPPPETESAGMEATAEGRSNVQAETPESAAAAVVVPNDDPSRGTGSGSARITRGRPDDTVGDPAPAPELSPLSRNKPEPNTLSPRGDQPLGESQNTVNLTLCRERDSKLATTGPSNLRSKPATPSKLKLSLPDTPISVPSTGHRSLTSLVPGESPDNDSEDELTTPSFLSLFDRPTREPTSSTKSTRSRRAPQGTPTKPKRRSSAVRLSAAFSAERPSAPEESVMRTPGGTIRKCGERGLKCGKDFCFTCC